MLECDGRSLGDVLGDLRNIVRDFTLVAHNARFNMSFVNYELDKCGHSLFNNDVVYTLELARKDVYGLDSYKLKPLAESLGVDSLNSTHNDIEVLLGA